MKLNSIAQISGIFAATVALLLLSSATFAYSPVTTPGLGVSASDSGSSDSNSSDSNSSDSNSSGTSSDGSESSVGSSEGSLAVSAGTSDTTQQTTDETSDPSNSNSSGSSSSSSPNGGSDPDEDEQSAAMLISIYISSSATAIVTTVGGLLLTVMAIDNRSAELFIRSSAVALRHDLRRGAGASLEDLAHLCGIPADQFSPFAGALHRHRDGLLAHLPPGATVDTEVTRAFLHSLVEIVVATPDLTEALIAQVGQ